METETEKRRGRPPLHPQTEQVESPPEQNLEEPKKSQCSIKYFIYPKPENAKEAEQELKPVQVQCQRPADGTFGHCRKHSWAILKSVKHVNDEHGGFELICRGELLPEDITDKERQNLFVQGFLAKVDEDGNIIPYTKYQDLPDETIEMYCRFSDAELIEVLRGESVSRRTLLKFKGRVRSPSVLAIINDKIAAL